MYLDVSAVYAIGQIYLSIYVGVSLKQIGVYVFFLYFFCSRVTLHICQ